MARVREAEGDLDGALDLLDEAERRYVSDFFPNVRPVPALTARVWVAQGELAEALGWVRERGLSVDDDLSYLREFEHITLARVLLAQHATDARRAASSTTRPDSWSASCERRKRGARTGSVIEILVLQALAHQARRRHPRCAGCAATRLTLAEPEGYVRIFVDEGPPMASLLRAAAKQGIAPSYARRLAGRLDTRPRTCARPSGLDRAAERTRTGRASAARNRPGRSGHRSRALVSLNTVRTHTKNIYAKLGVQQPSSSGAPGQRTRPAVARPRPLTQPRRIDHITGQSTCGDASSSHLALPFGQAGPKGSHMSDDIDRRSHRRRPDRYEIRLKGTSTPAGPPGSTD